MNLSLQAVKNKFVFLQEEDHKLAIADFTKEQENTILGYLDYLYQSNEAKVIFNQMERINEPIRVFASNSFGGVRNLPSLGGNFFDPKPALFIDMGIFNTEYPEELEIEEYKLGYISETGEFVNYDVELAFMHELVHSITGLTDNDGQRGFTSRADSAGDTQVEANKIHADLQELGLDAPIRISYDGTRDIYGDGEEPQSITAIKEGTQFTEGKLASGENPEITLGVFVIPSNVDTSNNSPKTNDLLISGGLQGDKEFITGAGHDYLYGGKGNDKLNSGSDNDYINGRRGNDNLDGGMGEDTAEFSDVFENYDIETDDGITTITHEDSGIDGVDTLKNIEFGIFNGEQTSIGTLSETSSSEGGIETQSFVASEGESAPRIVPLPLVDGVEKTEVVEVVDNTANPNPNDPPTPPHVSLTAPVDMLDGDVEYTVNISPYEPSSQYNIVYMVDTSTSMNQSKLQQTKDAYTDLTNHLINSKLGEKINFGVVSFRRNAATLDSDLNASEALTSIQNLTTTTTVDGTEYDKGLIEAKRFFNNSSLDEENATNIGYLATDSKSGRAGQFSFNTYRIYAQSLRNSANVQAFGINDDPFHPSTVVQSQINYVDSNDGLLVDDASQLSSQFLKSGLIEDVESVNILLDGEVVDTLTPDQFTDSPLGLTYSGTAENAGEIKNLDVSVDAENIITAEVVFTPESNFATTEVEHTVSAGEGEVVDENGNPIDESGNEDEDPFERTRNGSDGNDDITLGFVDKGANGGAGGDYIVGNRRDNILDGGEGNDTIFGHEGNDTIITGAGTDKVDGGEDIDTVLYSDVVYQGNSNLSFGQVGNTVIYNSKDYLTDIEFLQFSDVRISAETLEVTPILEVGETNNLTEGDTGNNISQYTLTLDTIAPVDVMFDYTTEDIDAIAGTDYVSTSGQITIPAGETTASLDLEIIGDVDDEGIETFSLNFTSLTGATFSDNRTEYSTVIGIENDDLIEPLVLSGDENNNFIKGDILEDLLSGKGGDDTLAGNAGDDTLFGGEGKDILIRSSR